MNLLGQALVAGAALLAIFGVVIPSNPATTVLLHDMVLWGLLVNMLSILVGELWMPHGTQDAAQAARLILRGAYSRLFWGMVIGGHLPSPSRAGYVYLSAELQCPAGSYRAPPPEHGHGE